MHETEHTGVAAPSLEDPPVLAPEAEEPDETVLGSEDTLIVNVDGYEGPLDVLLMLARTQKVDLKRISILALVEQYLAFIQAARSRRLELAAEYLVMAAWLTYLKSRLLLPPPDEEEGPTAEELAARLQFQLQRLEAMRKVGQKLFARNLLGQDVFARGMPEHLKVVRRPQYSASLFDLLKAYARQRTRGQDVAYEPKRPVIFAIEDARHRLEKMLGVMIDWSNLVRFLPELGLGEDREKLRRTALASSFTAGLELVRDGILDMRQLRHFGPIYVRRRKEAGHEVAAATTMERE